ncbi:hypothetical protein HD554DRAFT_2102825 [Boletus coccyginus]|nr:hypothetical protein HD554DRAFT_2102825 [Boletus coccyginus]
MFCLSFVVELFLHIHITLSHLPLLQVFDNVTPEEFNFISMLPAEDRCHQSIVKLVYLSNSHQLIAMAPYAIHEAPIHHFSKCVDKMLSRLSLDDDDDITMEVHTNLTIEDDAANNLIIPDFYLDLCSLAILEVFQFPYGLERLDLAQVCH